MTAGTLQRSQRSRADLKGNPYLKVAIVFATISTIVINALANIVPFNNQQTGDISDRFQILFVPAGYVFSIWGVIYLGMLAYSVYQARQKESNIQFWQQLGWLYLISCIANSAWIFLWHWNQLGWSVVVISILLLSLLAMYLQMVSRGWENGNRSTSETWAVYVPLSIYFAWGCVATVANVSTWLWNLGWDGWGIPATSWAIIMLLVAGLLGLVFGYERRNFAYAAVIIWAFVGIGVKQAAVPSVAYTAYALAALVLIAGVLGLRRTAQN